MPVGPVDRTGARDGRGYRRLAVGRLQVSVPCRRRVVVELKSWTGWWRAADAVGGWEEVEGVEDDVVDVLNDS